MVCYMTNQETLARVKTWVKEQASPGIVIVPARSKAGLSQACAEDNSLLFMETSARTALNVKNPFLTMAKKLPQSEPQNPGGCS